jgi:hypothetical protein
MLTADIEPSGDAARKVRIFGAIAINRSARLPVELELMDELVAWYFKARSKFVMPYGADALVLSLVEKFSDSIVGASTTIKLDLSKRRGPKYQNAGRDSMLRHMVAHDWSTKAIAGCMLINGQFLESLGTFDKVHEAVKVAIKRLGDFDRDAVKSALPL